MASPRFAFLNDRRWWLAAAAAFPVWIGLLYLRKPASASVSISVSAWLLNVVAYPVLEEIVFRGGLLAYLKGKAPLARGLYGISPANLIAALVFAAMHLFAHAPLWAAAVFIPGLIFGWCYERWGLGAAIAMHLWYNFGYFTLYPPSV